MALFHNFNFILNVEFLSHNYELPFKKKKSQLSFFSSLLAEIGFHTMNLQYDMNIFVPEY